MNIFSQNNLPKWEKSLVKIENLLLEMNVATIEKEMEGDDISSIFFTAEDGDAIVKFRIPLFVDEIEKTIASDYRRVDRKTKFDIKQRARDIMFSEMFNYLEMISVMIKLNQASLRECLLAFVYNGKQDKTFYEMLESGDHKLLED